MEWIYALSYFFAGAFLTNAIPHLVSGLMGRPLARVQPEIRARFWLRRWRAGAAPLRPG